MNDTDIEHSAAPEEPPAFLVIAGGGDEADRLAGPITAAFARARVECLPDPSELSAALAAARRADPDGPLIVVGGELGADDVAALLDGGADGYVGGDRLERLAATVQRAGSRAFERRRQHTLEVELSHANAMLTRARSVAEAAEAAAADCRSRLQALLEHAPVALSVADPRGGYLALSRTAAALVGVQLPAPGAELPHPDHPLYSPAARPVLDAHETTVRATGKAVNFEIVLTNPDGAVRDYECTKYPVFDADGSLSAVGGITIDVTDRKHAELISRALLEAAAEPSLIVGLDGRIRLAGSAAATLFGYPRNELAGEPIARLLPGLDWAARVAALRAGSHSTTPGDTGRLPLTGCRKDGSALAVELDLSELGTPGVPFVVATIRDAAAHLEALRALEETESRFGSAFAEAPIGLALIGLEGDLLCVNTTLCQIVGFSAEDLIATGLDALSHPDDVDAHAAHVDALLSEEIPDFRLEKRYFNRRGHTIWVSLSVSLARDAAGEPRHLIAAIEDISATKSAEATLREANAQLQALFDHAPAWLTLRALDGRYINANDQVIKSLNTTRHELIGSHPGTHVDAETAARMHADDHRVWETREPLTCELAVADEHGELHTYHEIRYPVLDDGGEVSAFGSFALDVTDRTRSEAARERALAEFEEAQRIARVGSWSWDPATATAVWSREMYRIFGLDPDSEVTDRSLIDLALAPERSQHRVIFERVRAGQNFDFEYQITAADGVERSLYVVGRHDPERPGCFSGTCQDVTELRGAERMLRVAEERFRNAFEHAPVGMLLADLDGRFVKVNDALCAMLGYRPDELLATTSGSITHPEDVDLGREQTEQLLRGEIDYFHREKRLLRAAGDPLWVAVHVSVLRDRDGRPLQFVQQVVDITERRRLEKELRHLADHDPLTGLVNRRGLESELERQLARVERYGDRGALLVLDLDHFKTVNDTLGHEAGDQLIVSVAEILTERLRSSDIVARLGGDEFAVLLPEADLEAAEAVARQLVTDVHDHAIVSGGQMPRHVTASIGVTTFHQGLAGGEEALVNADLAMYEAKETGRDRVAVHTPDRNARPRGEARLAWIERIRAALENDQLTLVSQPVVALSGSEVRHHELLLRMVEAGGDSIPPGAFLYIAERYDLVQELDRWVASRAIRLLETGVHSGALGLNISARSLADDELLDLVERELRRSGINPAQLVFEVTEAAAIANIQLTRRFAERLEALGCRFALDDFGAGFGSFYYLKHIHFDFLKIDGELVSGCRTNQTDRLVIESLVAIARGLEKQTVAKGVEDGDTHDFLSRLGVDFAQGYHYGHPAPVAVPAPIPTARTRRAAHRTRQRASNDRA